MSVHIKTYRNVFGSIDNEGNLLPNNNVLYGPYESIDEAYDTIYNELGDDIPIGLTIGIKVDDKITEYWFNKGITKYNLVPKNEIPANENVDIEDIKTDINKNKNNITLLDKNIEALSLSIRKIIDGRTVVAEAGKAGKAEKDPDGNAIKTTYTKQEDYNYTLGTALATSELGKYLNISHNYNKTLAIPYATKNNGGAMSAEDKKLVDSITEREAQLSEQIQLVELDIKTIISDTIDEVEKDYSKKSNTLRHFYLSPIATANGLSLLLEGEYDDSVQGSHLLEHNIILPYATESKAGIMSPEDKKALTQIIEGGVTEEYVNDAISEAITKTLNTEV